MILLDSNIIIYSSQPEFRNVRNFIARNDCCVSVISIVETLGYHKLKESEKRYFEKFFQIFKKMRITNAIIDIAVELRQAQKLSLGDSIIAATAIANNLTIATNNIDDFKHIKGLNLINPLNSAHS